MWRTVKRIIRRCDSFLLTTHVNPDGDGVGAATAMIELLLQLGKQGKLVCGSPIPKRLQFLNYHNAFELFDPEHTDDQTEVVIVLDAHRRDRIGPVAAACDREGVVTICIDHHHPISPFTTHSVIDPKACSAGAMVYTLYKEMGLDLNLNAATGIYASVICDTGRFSYSSTSRKAHKIADECIKLGVDPDLMHSRLFQHISLAEAKMFARALNRMETHCSNKVIIQQISQSDVKETRALWSGVDDLDLEYLHEFNKNIENVECVVLLRELEHKNVRISLRSMSALDVSAVVKTLGGGGHSKAAGAICNGTLLEVKDKVLSLVATALNQ